MNNVGEVFWPGYKADTHTDSSIASLGRHHLSIITDETHLAILFVSCTFKYALLDMRCFVRP